MMQEAKLTYRAKVELYSSLDKAQLIEMLIEANKYLEQLTPKFRDNKCLKCSGTGYLYSYDGTWCVTASKCECSNKKPTREVCLISKKGEAIYEGDKYWFVTSKNNVFETIADSKSDCFNVAFKTQQEAEEFAILNTPTTIQELIEHGHLVAGSPQTENILNYIKNGK